MGLPELAESPQQQHGVTGVSSGIGAQFKAEGRKLEGASFVVERRVSFVGCSLDFMLIIESRVSERRYFSSQFHAITILMVS